MQAPLFGGRLLNTRDVPASEFSLYARGEVGELSQTGCCNGHVPLFYLLLSPGASSGLLAKIKVLPEVAFVTVTALDMGRVTPGTK